MSAGLVVPDHLKDNPRAAELFAEFTAIVRANPLQGYNHPGLPRVHKKQLEFHAIKPQGLGIKGLLAGNRAGKTVGCVVDDIIQAVDESVLPEHLKDFKKFQPPFRCWIGAPKFDKHQDTIIPLLRKFLPRDQLVGDSFDKAFKKQDRLLLLKNGSTFGFKTYDQDLDAWASAELERIHWDEEPNGEHGERLRSEARGRLVSTNGDEIIGMTPLLGYSWVHDQVWECRHEPNVDVVTMEMGDNPWNSKEAIAAFEAGLTEEEKRARIKGEFVHFGGLFFDEFRDSLHVVDPPNRQALESQETVVGIDPGLRRTGVTWTAFDNDNAAITFDEFYPAESVVPDIAEEIKRRNEFWGIEPSVYVIDPSARNRSAINADQVEAAYMREEIYCQHGQNDRAAGILEMKRRLQAQDAQERPSPTWLISEDCKTLIWEIGRYRRDPNANDEFTAIKQDDHLLDSVRYAILSRTWHVPELSEQPKRFSTPHYQAPYADERFAQDVAPLGSFS